jgi:hypothetical protein
MPPRHQRPPLRLRQGEGAAGDELHFRGEAHHRSLPRPHSQPGLIPDPDLGLSRPFTGAALVVYKQKSPTFVGLFWRRGRDGVCATATHDLSLFALLTLALVRVYRSTKQKPQTSWDICFGGEGEIRTLARAFALLQV